MVGSTTNWITVYEYTSPIDGMDIENLNVGSREIHVLQLYQHMASLAVVQPATLFLGMSQVGV